MKRTLSCSILLLVTFVNVAFWNCGCLFADVDTVGPAVTVKENPPSCHAKEENSPKEEDCCPQCQLEDQGPLPDRIGVAESYQEANLNRQRVELSIRGRVSSSDLALTPPGGRVLIPFSRPLLFLAVSTYLMNQSFLI